MLNVKITSQENIKNAKKLIPALKKIGTFNYKGEMQNFEYEERCGKVQTFEFTKPIGEMIVSSESQAYFLKEAYLEIELGKNEHPVVYSSLYETISDSNFPETFKAIWMQWGRVVFLQHIEGQEVKFGTREAEEGDTASIVCYTAGFEYTEDMVLYNKTFDMQTLNKAMGEAYNALLNHIHLFPIIDFGYTSANQTSASTNFDTPAFPDWDDYTRLVMNTRMTLIDAVKATRQDDPSRIATKLLIHSSNEQVITDALGGLQVAGNFPTKVVGIDEVILYDGTSITVGAQTFTYTGCPTDKAYLIQPKKYLKELVKHDLIVDAGDADLSRLIEKQIVGRTRRGVYAGVARSVEEITLPS